MGVKQSSFFKAIAVVSTFSASALTFTDSISYLGQNGGLPVVGLVMAPAPLGATTVNGLFDITDSGYLPGVQGVVSSTATFTFTDALLNETFNITLDGNAFLTQVNLLDLSTSTLPLPPNDSVLGPALLTLSNTGKLAYQINRTSGAFSLISAQLTVQAVPEASALMPALGILAGGVFLVHRRQAKR